MSTENGLRVRPPLQCNPPAHDPCYSVSWSPGELATSVGSFSRRAGFFGSPNLFAHPTLGSHVVFALQQTRRYKVISIDNHHNSHPAVLTHVAQLARDALPENATDADKESAEIDAVQCDLTSHEQVKAVFEKYGKGGIWGVVHIAVRVRCWPCDDLLD